MASWRDDPIVGVANPAPQATNTGSWRDDPIVSDAGGRPPADPNAPLIMDRAAFDREEGRAPPEKDTSVWTGFAAGANRQAANIGYLADAVGIDGTENFGKTFGDTSNYSGAENFDVTDPSTYGYVANAVTENIPQIGKDLVAMGVGTAAGGPIGGIAAPVLLEFADTMGSSLNDIAHNKGVSIRELDDTDWAAAMATSTVVSAAERLGLGAMMPSQMKSFLKGRIPGILKTFGIEGGTEAVEEVAQQVGTTVTTDQGAQIDPMAVVNSGVLGGLVGNTVKGGLEAPGTVVNAYKRATTDTAIDTPNIPRGGAPTPPRVNLPQTGMNFEVDPAGAVAARVPSDPASIGGVTPIIPRPAPAAAPPAPPAMEEASRPAPSAAARLAERMSTVAGDLGADLANIDPNAESGAKVVMDRLHTIYAEDIKALAADLREHLDPRYATDFEDTMRRAGMKATERGAKNKVKDVISQKDIDVVRQATGFSRQGERLANLMEESSLRSQLHRGGMAGGLSKWLQSVGLERAATYAMGGKTNAIASATGLSYAGSQLGAAIGGPLGATVGAVASPVGLAGIYGAARGLDALSGRRSRPARFVAKNANPASVTESRRREEALPDLLQEKADAAQADALANQDVNDTRDTELRKTRRAANAVGLGGVDRMIFDKTGLKPRAVDEGLRILENEGVIRPSEVRAFHERPNELMKDANGADANTGNRIFDLLDMLAEQGRIERTPLGTTPSAAPPAADTFQMARYKAGAARNVQSNLEAKDRVEAAGLDPTNAAIIAGTIDDMGGINNRADAEAAANRAIKAVEDSGDARAHAVAVSELTPLLQNFRHATKADAESDRAGARSEPQAQPTQQQQSQAAASTSQQGRYGPGVPGLGDGSRAPGADLDRPPVNADGTVTLDHFSAAKEDIARTDPELWGTSGLSPREERNRVSVAPKRTYFGIATGKPGGYRKEYGLEGRKHYTGRIPLDELYDIAGDPDNLSAVRAAAPNEKGIDPASQLEQLIKNAGYAGYWRKHPSLGLVAAVYKPVDIVPGGGKSPSQVQQSRNTPSTEQRDTQARQQADQAARQKKSGGPKAAEGQDAPAQQQQAKAGPSGTRPQLPTGNRISRTPSPAARATAEAYRADTPGLLPPLDHSLDIDETYLKRVADWLDTAQSEPDDPFVAKSYKALVSETVDQYKALIASGLKVEAFDGTGEPYLNSGEMLDDVKDNNHLWFFRTDNGFGSTEDADTGKHPMMAKTKFKDSKGRTLLANDLFRIVHDYFGHGQNAFQFGPKGEYNAFQEHARMFSTDAVPALAAETLAQNAWVNFGPHLRNDDGSLPKKGDEKFVEVKDRPFADQIAAAVPWEVLLQDTNPEAIATQRFGKVDKKGKSQGYDMDLVHQLTHSVGTDMKTGMKIALKAPGIGTVLNLLTPDERTKVSAVTAHKMVDIFDSLPSAQEMAAAAYAGRAKKGWYASSSKAILDVFGARDAPRFAALLAALSPQCSVETNALNAIKTWINWTQSQRPTDRASILRIMGESVEGARGEDSILGAWENNSVSALSAESFSDFALSGPKVNSFMLNLVGVLSEVTNDAWMASFGGVKQTLFKKNDTTNKGAGYMAFSARVRGAAQLLSKVTGEKWSPAEVQETIWSFAKTVYEARDVAGNEQSINDLLEAGGVTHGDIASTPDFATLFTDGVLAKLLSAGGYEDELDAIREDKAERGGEEAAGTPGGRGSILDIPEGPVSKRLAFRDNVAKAASRLEALRTERRTKGKADDRAIKAKQKPVNDDAADDFI